MKFFPGEVASPARQLASIRRRQLLALSSLGLVVSTANAGPVELQLADSLPDVLAQALAKRMPLLVMVSLEGCPFCKVARNNYLGPLRDQQGVPIVQVNMRTSQSIKDFGGLMSTHDQMAKGWGIKIAPTVLFFGQNGAEVAERLVGGYIPDFYGAYLDERLRVAQLAVRQQK